MLLLATVLSGMTVIIAVLSILAKAMSSNPQEKFFSLPLIVLLVVSIAAWVMVFIV